MSDKVKQIKKSIEDGTYDWKYSVETCAEKLVLLHELGLW